MTLHYDGAAATVVFNESGSAAFPRERLTVLGKGRVAILDDFAKLTVHGHKTAQQGGRLRKSMGHKEAVQQFVRAIQGKPNHLLSWEDASLATTCMFAARESIRIGAEIDVAAFRKSLLEGAESTPNDDRGELGGPVTTEVSLTPEGHAL